MTNISLLMLIVGSNNDALMPSRILQVRLILWLLANAVGFMNMIAQEVMALSSICLASHCDATGTMFANKPKLPKADKQLLAAVTIINAGVFSRATSYLAALWQEEMYRCVLALPPRRKYGADQLGLAWRSIKIISSIY